MYVFVWVDELLYCFDCGGGVIFCIEFNEDVFDVFVDGFLCCVEDDCGF